VLNTQKPLCWRLEDLTNKAIIIWSYFSGVRTMPGEIAILICFQLEGGAADPYFTLQRLSTVISTVDFALPTLALRFRESRRPDSIHTCSRVQVPFGSLNNNKTHKYINNCLS